MESTTETQRSGWLEMHLDYDGGNTLQETVRWSKFLAIVGFIGLGIYLLVVLVAGSLISTLVQQRYSLEGGALVGLVVVGVIVILAIFAVIVIMLYRFSVLTRRGIALQDQAIFNRGLKSLKIYFMINGVLAVLTLVSTIYNTVNSFI